MSLISIAIPTFNRRDYLIECINSILSQTFKDFCILVFDSGSDYNMESVLKDLNDDRITLVPSPNKLTAHQNFNRIFYFHYDTEFAMAFHDDDTMHPRFLEIMLAKMAATQDLVFIGSGMKFVKGDESMLIFPNEKKCRMEICGTYIDFVRLLISGFPLCFGSVIYRTKFFPVFSLSDIYDKWGDRPYLIEYAKKGRVGIIKNKLINYRVHPAQDSRAVHNKKELVYIKRLFNTYKDCIWGSHHRELRRLFHIFVADNVLLTSGSFATGMKDFFSVVKDFRDDGLFGWYWITPRGVYYFLRFIVRTYLR